MLYPLTFHPILKERVWGGRNLEALYGKILPSKSPYGESWEITDRPEGTSVIANGPWEGKTLNDLMLDHKEELLGTAKCQDGHFPLLVKILDAQNKLSIQVHPPAEVADRLSGQPKTEMWYVAGIDTGADLYVGLKKGVTAEEFTQRITDGTVADCFHRIEPSVGDSLLLESGRVHALGAGNIIFEIQQNSDTTYRVFDWNRVGLDGKPRDLHIDQALASIDFNDFEPSMKPRMEPSSNVVRESIVDHPLFSVNSVGIPEGESIQSNDSQCQVIAVTEGSVELEFEGDKLERTKGDFVLLPACLSSLSLRATKDSHLLVSVPH